MIIRRNLRDKNVAFRILKAFMKKLDGVVVK